tara:strand:+ start:1242 stop:1361 length:120 start_codon:yes stop_codon:yes gene_type:complete
MSRPRESAYPVELRVFLITPRKMRIEKNPPKKLEEVNNV